MKTHLVVEIEHEGGTTLRPDTTSELVRAEVEQMLIEISQKMRWEAVTVLLSLRRPVR